jgi:hypothetical protein
LKTTCKNLSFARIYLCKLAICAIALIPFQLAMADGYWGFNSQGPGSYSLSPSSCWGNRYSNDFLSPGNDVVVDTFIISCNGQNYDPRIVFGIYDESGGLPYNRIALSDTLAITGNSMQRWTLPAGINIAAGSTYTLCVDIVGANGPLAAYNTVSLSLSRYNSATFPARWTEFSNNSVHISLAAYYRDSVASGSPRRKIIIGGEK